MRIDQAVPDYHVLSVINTNGSQAYFVTEEAIRRGGYEVNQFLYRYLQAYCENADFALIQATLENLKKL